MQKQIMLPCEVVERASLARDYPTRPFCQGLIPQVEEAVANSCIGWSFYQDLLGDLTPIAGFVAGKEGVKYPLGSVIQYDCKYYEALVSEVYLSELKDASKWDYKPKFQSPSNNDLFEGYLARYLALQIYVHSLTETTIKSSANGLIVNEGDSMGNRTVRKEEMVLVKDSILKNIAMVESNMKAWIARQQKNGLFANFGLSPCESTANCAAATIGFKRRRILI